MPTTDHVALLLAMRAGATLAHSAADLAAMSRLRRDIVDVGLRDLAGSGLVRTDGGAVLFAGIFGTLRA